MNREQAVKRLHDELEAWPKLSECPSGAPKIPGWRWEGRAAKATLERRQPSGFSEVITETDWRANYYHFKHAERFRDAWTVGEERIDRIAQSDASGDHYAEDSDAESALSQALGMPSKYHVRLKGAWCDVYDVLQAFGVTNPGDQHAIKKMLMPGKRGHKDGIQDRREAIQSLHRAIELEGES